MVHDPAATLALSWIPESHCLVDCCMFLPLPHCPTDPFQVEALAVAVESVQLEADDAVKAEGKLDVMGVCGDCANAVG